MLLTEGKILVSSYMFFIFCSLELFLLKHTSGSYENLRNDAQNTLHWCTCCIGGNTVPAVCPYMFFYTVCSTVCDMGTWCEKLVKILGIAHISMHVCFCATDTHILHICVAIIGIMSRLQKQNPLSAEFDLPTLNGLLLKDDQDLNSLNKLTARS